MGFVKTVLFLVLYFQLLINIYFENSQNSSIRDLTNFESDVMISQVVDHSFNFF